MTTKPKARKFRIRRAADADEHANVRQGAAPSGDVRPTDGPHTPEPQQQGDAPRSDAASSTREPGTSQNIDDIRNEGLTGRQLRIARRVAHKHGLAPTSDFDAVRLLRAKGIDPFHRASILDLVTTDKTETDIGALVPAKEQGTDTPRVQLPQTISPQTTLPSSQLSPADRRSEEIMRIQRDIGKRRRRKLLLLLTRLAAFVFLPTLLAGYYYYAVATPMYATKSEFLILSADGGGGGGMGGFKLPSQFATGQDAVATQSYLLSKDAMLRLDRDVGFRDHFSQPWIDPIQRLKPDASNEKAYKVYKKYMKIGYDPTEGVLRMEISSADPEVSAEFSRKLITYAEERVDDLSRRKREDAVESSTTSLAEAKEERREAQRKLVTMQEGTVLDPEGEIANIRSLIGNVELQLQEKQLALNTQMNNARPNNAKVEALTSEILVLQREQIKQRARLTDAAEGSASLASQTADIQMAQADLLTADMVLQAALEAQRMTASEANKQVRYLTVSVNPVASQDASYPRAFENTILAFLVFAGIYLMISLTASILREQVSS
ncbi:capsule biosynthesis protein [Roseovarius sp. M141]|uniref:capsule biosynthesis protein n=1 Tax=Roseovarius sp. M141 TaxID=2583806 RepID=UPI0020CD7F01|nr:capsule biosynthesis protein [Roseovarius sp. M141]MCQ0092057.1 capsule biosynthesis protein [Roseovarius sp. M141]